MKNQVENPNPLTSPAAIATARNRKAALAAILPKIQHLFARALVDGIKLASLDGPECRIIFHAGLQIMFAQYPDSVYFRVEPRNGYRSVLMTAHATPDFKDAHIMSWNNRGWESELFSGGLH